MANTLTAVIPTILARGLMALREYAMFPQLVNKDYSEEATKPGTTITIPIPSAQTASAVVPGPYPPTPADTTPLNATVTLDQWYHTDFHLSDKDAANIIAQESFLPGQVSESFRALANNVNSYIAGKYLGVYGWAGVAGTTPFASAITEAITARSVLGKQKCPLQNRSAVIDFAASANALALAPFRDASQSADGSVIREGQIGRKLGMQWYEDHGIPTHTTGSLSDGTSHKCLVNGAVSAGAKTVNVDSTTLTGTIVPGDVFYVGTTLTQGVTQTYVVTNTSTLTASGNAIAGVTFEPAAPTGGFADNATLTFMASHTVNLAFHRDAFAFASRPLVRPGLTASDRKLSMTMVDPITSMAVRLEVIDEYKQTAWDLDVCYGASLVRRELASRLAG